ncbi:MAG TPA: amino acid adenylation domain-containing protein, partial [Streptosporangiaceae bacterium]
GGVNTAGAARSVVSVLPGGLTEELLTMVPGVYRTQVNDVLLMALAVALRPLQAGPGGLAVDVEGHGREDLFSDVDLSRTVGWFTVLYPVVLELADPGDVAGCLKAVKETLRAVPRHGIGYGLARYVRGELDDGPAADVVFNYLGRVDQPAPGGPVRLAGGGPGADRSPRAARGYALDVNAAVIGGELRVSWTYAPGLHDRATIEAAADRFGQALAAVTAHCRDPRAGGYTPSDFPLAGLDQDGLDAVVAGRRDVEDVFPLTALQAGMMFHSLSAPESGVYVEQSGVDFTGGFDAEAFAAAWQQLAGRHAVLRSSVAWQQGLGEPLQVVYRQVPVPVSWHDWREIEDLDRYYAGFLARDRAAGFDLGRAPLMRLAVARVGADAWRVTWTFHHLILDGWSIPVVLGEVLALYRQAVEGTAAGLAPPRPYRDYVAWLRGQDAAAAGEYWRGYLAGFTEPTPLVISRPAGPDERGRGVGVHRVTVSAPASQALADAARAHRVTASTVLQAAWGLLLGRYADSSDVVFGVTSSGRSVPLDGMDTMVGCFINTLPARVRWDDTEPVTAVWGRLQDEQLQARQFEHTPLPAVQRHSQVPPGTALFDSLLVYENYPVDTALAALAGPVTATPVVIAEQTNYPLTVIAVPGPGGLALSLSYDPACIDPAAVERLAGHLTGLLEQIAADPQAPAGSLSVLGEREREQVLGQWNDTGAVLAGAGQAATLAGLFEVAADRVPDAAAVVAADGELSYRELDERASRLAHYLRELGAGPGTVSGVCLERGTDMIVAVLAVLKAGGAYLPLDAGYPADRLGYMLADSGAALVVTHSGLDGRLPAGQARRVRVDELGPVLAAHPATRPVPAAGPADLAYIIYTSGSTGRPKGVMIEHRSAVNFVCWAGEFFTAEDLARVLFATSLCFDLSVFEIFGPLAHGGAVVVAQDVLAVAGGVSLLNSVPSAVRALVQRGGCPQGIRSVNLAGEALSRELAVQVRQAFAPRRVLNLYGPSEATTYATAAVVDPDEPGVVPIGGPVANTRVYVLDGWMRPVPAGVPGELFVGGVQLARGYLGRPGLTARCFVPDLFGAAGQRLYRTGDTVRWRADGLLEFVGRADAQVKVRGFRVELGEVEAVLAAHPQVADAVVDARADPGGHQRLAGYVIPAGPDGTAGTAGAGLGGVLRDYLRQLLPDYMIPSAFVVVDSFPVTANGKLDRAALPDPVVTGTSSGFLAPRTPAEQVLAGIWGEVLGVERVGVHDNFFELGGDSILTIQVVARARRAGLRVSPRMVFAAQTVAELAGVAGDAPVVAAEQGA